DVFRPLLQINLTVLATVHAVSEGIVRGVAGEMTRKAAPQTYGVSGRAIAPAPHTARPAAVNRTLLGRRGGARRQGFCRCTNRHQLMVPSPQGMHISFGIPARLT